MKVELSEQYKPAVVKGGEPKPWTICPECKCGPGEDHKRGCSRAKRPSRAAKAIGNPEGIAAGSE